MIYYFTALVISYSMDVGSVTTSYVWYDRELHCQEAMNDSLADPLYNQLYELYDDLHMTCVVSDQVSFILKPRLRPKEE
jgi:hypothetical protein